jgi:hypothetical protein
MGERVTELSQKVEEVRLGIACGARTAKLPGLGTARRL